MQRGESWGMSLRARESTYCGVIESGNLKPKRKALCSAFQSGPRREKLSTQRKQKLHHSNLLSFLFWTSKSESITVQPFYYANLHRVLLSKEKKRRITPATAIRQ
jgi:hypothetical protein